MNTTSPAPSKFAVIKCRRCLHLESDHSPQTGKCLALHSATPDEPCVCPEFDPIEITFVAIGPFAWGRGKDIEAAIRNAKKEVSRAYVRKPYKMYVYEVQQFAGISDMDGGISYKGDVPPKQVRLLENQRPPR